MNTDEGLSATEIRDLKALLARNKPGVPGNFWEQPWPEEPDTTRGELLLSVMCQTMRPSAPSESICDGYQRLQKLHDREPQVLVEAIKAIDPQFFDPLIEKHLRSQMGIGARLLLRNGKPAYAKPLLRKQPTPAANAPNTTAEPTHDATEGPDERANAEPLAATTATADRETPLDEMRDDEEQDDDAAKENADQ